MYLHQGVSTVTSWRRPHPILEPVRLHQGVSTDTSWLASKNLNHLALYKPGEVRSTLWKLTWQSFVKFYTEWYLETWNLEKNIFRRRSRPDVFRVTQIFSLNLVVHFESRAHIKTVNSSKKIKVESYSRPDINLNILWEILLTSLNFNANSEIPKIKPEARQEFSSTESASHHILEEWILFSIWMVTFTRKINFGCKISIFVQLIKN